MERRKQLAEIPIIRLNKKHEIQKFYFHRWQLFTKERKKNNPQPQNMKMTIILVLQIRDKDDLMEDSHLFREGMC